MDYNKEEMSKYHITVTNDHFYQLILEKKMNEVTNNYNTLQKQHTRNPFNSRVTKLAPYLYLLPILIFSALFTYYPFIRTFLYSFSTVNFKGEITKFIGLENFKFLFSNPNFYNALAVTMRLVVMFVVLNLIFSLGLALLCCKKRKLSWLNELMIILPMAVSMSALAMIFKLMLNPTAGIINHILHIDWGWFSDKQYALLGILLVCLWMGISFDFLLFLSALRNVPVSVMEAAAIDGAGPFTRFFRIRLPIISPIVFYVICTNVIQSIMTSGPVMILTEGGPARSTTTLVYMMFTSGYQSSNYSLSACISLVVFALTLLFTVLAFSFEKKGVHYQ